MPIIQRYIFIELFKFFSVSVFFLTGLLFLNKFFDMTNLIFNQGVTLTEILRIIIYISPGFLALTIPIGLFFCSVVVFNQFSADNELDAMKASGMSFYYLMKPVIVMSLLAYIISNIMVFYAQPWGNHSFKKLIFNIIETRASVNIKPKVFNSDFKGMTVYVKTKSSNNTFKDIFVSDNSNKGFNKVILSKKGRLVSDPENMIVQLRMQNGTIHDLSQGGRSYNLVNFERYDLNLAYPGFGKLRHGIFIGNRELSYGKLRQKIESLEKKGGKANAEKVEMSKKFSIPFTCLLFALAGAPLGIKSSSSGKPAGYMVGALGILVYYILLSATQTLGTQGELNAYFSVWVPNIVVFLIAGIMVYKVQYEIPFTSLNRLTNFLIEGYRFSGKIYTNLFPKKSIIQKLNGPKADMLLKRLRGPKAQ